MGNPENKHEVKACQVLEEHLQIGETLLAFTRANIVNFTAIPHYIGLTQNRLILIPLKGKSPPASISRQFIQKITYSKFWSRWEITLEKDKIYLSVRKGFWKKRASELVQTHQAKPISTPPGTTFSREDILQKIRALETFGFTASAQAELEKLGIHSPDVLEMVDTLKEKRLTFRIAAAFLIVNVLLVIGLQLLVTYLGETTEINYGAIIIDIAIGITLWQGRDQYRVFAIARAVLGWIIFGFLSFTVGDYSIFIYQSAFSGSLILVLTGKPSRTRTLISSAIYLIGFVGLFVVSILLIFI